MSARLPRESFEDYRRRIKDEAGVINEKLKGRMIFMSRSQPFKDPETGKAMVRTATYRKKRKNG